MLGQWRLTLRKAEHALKTDRLDEAVAYVTRPEVRSYRQARELMGRVAEALAHRAGELLRQGDSQRAWADVLQAQELGGPDAPLGALRQELVCRTLDEATDCLNGGRPESALATVDRLAKRGVNSAEARRLREAATAWQAAREHARAGRLAQASEQFEIARGLLPDCEPLEHAAQEAWAARDRLTTLEAELHRTLAGADWGAALAAADAILAIAPEHVPAQGRAAPRLAGSRGTRERRASSANSHSHTVQCAPWHPSPPTPLPQGERGVRDDRTPLR